MSFEKVNPDINLSNFGHLILASIGHYTVAVTLINLRKKYHSMEINYNSPYRFSSFVYCYSQKDQVCLFHSLTLKKIYGGKDLCQIFNYFQAPNSLTSFLPMNYLDDNILSLLVKLGFLITDKSEDDKLYNSLKKGLRNSHEIQCLYLLTSTHCNLMCTYCCVNHNKPKNYSNSNMSTEIALKSVDKFFKNSERPKYICFFGGEPLINFDVIKKTVEYCTHKYDFHSFKINTNGTLINKEISRFLAEHNFTIGVSIDGPAYLHDKCRIFPNNKKSFEEVIRGWYLLKEAGCSDAGIVTVLWSLIADNIEEVIDFLLDTFDPATINLEVVESIPKKILSDLRPTPDKVVKALVYNFLSLENKKNKRDNIISKHLDYFIEEKFNYYGCASHWGVIIVDPSGNFGPCFNFLSSNYFNADENNLQEWRKRSPINIIDCIKCPAIGICGGICAAHSRSLTGSIWGTDQIYSCEYTKKILEWMIWNLKERYSQNTKIINKLDLKQCNRCHQDENSILETLI